MIFSSLSSAPPLPSSSRYSTFAFAILSSKSLSSRSRSSMTPLTSDESNCRAFLSSRSTPTKYILKLVIEPAIELRKALAELSQLVLFHQARIISNTDPDEKIALELKRSASRLWGAAHTISPHSPQRTPNALASTFNLALGHVVKACRHVDFAFGGSESR
jgi:hypothetical protein